MPQNTHRLVKKIHFTLKKKDNQILIIIHNEGSYIDKENIKHIFDRFYRCDPARKYQGGLWFRSFYRKSNRIKSKDQD